MSTDYGLKKAQQMFPNVKPLPWPKNQPVAEIYKNIIGKYLVHIYGVTNTHVIAAGLRLICKEKNWYGYNYENMEVSLFDTLDAAELAYTSCCKRNERMIGSERLLINDVTKIGVVKEYL